ncbi:hypothetical protein [Aestuariimicrobium sp. Y1814]|uniref:hypothetical protein n=1 Tax=Aestuariimicrobium sp. Y1814 TaxID=3418742 RepID=UPI003DA75FC2
MNVPITGVPIDPRPLEHWNGCPTPDESRLTYYVNDQGHPAKRCDTCGKYLVDKHVIVPQLAEVEIEVVPAAGRQATRWVCRDHPQHGVDPRGKGCPRCAREHEQARTRRAPRKEHLQ